MRSRIFVIAMALAIALVAASSTNRAEAGAPRAARVKPDVDVRARVKANVPFSAAQRAELRKLGGVAVQRNVRQGVPSTVLRYGGFLTRPSREPAVAVARGFLASHAALFRLTLATVAQLEVARSYRTRHNGVRHVFFRQLDAGRPVFGSSIGVSVDGHGRVAIVGGAYFPAATAAGDAQLDAAQAVLATAGHVGATVTGPLVPLRGTEAKARFRNTIARGVARPMPITAELVTFPMPAGHPARVAWKTVLEVNDQGWYESVVDAATGSLLYRRNYYEHAGPEGLVYRVQHPDVAGSTQQTTAFSGLDGSWVADRRTQGNNVTAYQDLDNSNGVGYQPQTPASGDPGFQHLNYTFTDAWRTGAGADVDLTDGYADRDSTITQLFYYTNVMHDYLYGLGFNEASGNFQVNNFGRGGSGGDPVLAEAQDGWEDGVAQNCTDDGNPVQCANNANFGTPGDGASPRMQMYMWAPGRPYRDGSMDGDVIAHEYGHGVSSRLVGGGSLGGGVQTGAMGEGWSDFISVSKWDDNMVGEYVTGNTTSGIRPFAFDASPLKYSDLCNVNSSGACQVHRDGQIWVATLYDMRTKLVERYGSAGKNEAIQLVIDGMKNTPSSPSYLNARDGILTADTTTNGGANQCLIWGAFAGREMGVGAASSGSGDMNPTEATDGPAACTPTASIGGPYSTAEGVDEPLNGSASLNPGDPVNPPLTYAWDLDNDGQYDDATGATPSFTRVGQDGTYTIGLKVTNGYGFSDTDSGTVTVTNVNPTVSVDPIAGAPENTAISVSALVSDPGWLDPLTASVDWGDGAGPQPASGAADNARPNATLTLALTHVYGDNGTFTVTVCAADDDTSGNCASRAVTIANVVPTAAIDTTGSTLVNGIPTFIAHVGEPVTFSGASNDPGSDDEALSWSWGDGPPAPDVTTSYLNDGAVGPDPLPSPTINPRALTDSKTHAFADACFYTIQFGARDDDGGAAAHNAAVIIAGNATVRRGAGYWQTQYRPRPTAFPEAKRLCYLAITGFVSTVFDEARDASTVARAFDVLFVAGNGGSATQQLDRQLLAAWLNFANGSFEYAGLVDTNGDGTGDTPFSAVMATAEATRLNPASTATQLRAQRDLLERLNA